MILRLGSTVAVGISYIVPVELLSSLRFASARRVVISSGCAVATGTMLVAASTSVIYYDELAAMLKTGNAIISRASHVEPDSAGSWTADMSPVNGPVLGPFSTRQGALSAEVEWLDSKYITAP